MTKMHIFEMGLASGAVGAVGLKFLWGGAKTGAGALWQKVVTSVAAEVQKAQADVAKAVENAAK